MDFLFEPARDNRPKTGGDFYCGLRLEAKEWMLGRSFYTLFQQNGKDVAGMMNPTTIIRGRVIVVAIHCGCDVDACAARVPELGGTVMKHPKTFPVLAARA
jgi:predicted enzyme related to lactoylglutathione lyase